VPLYNQDLEDDFPETVINLKQTVEAADALVFSTPEYNGSIPGVLKNVIDWLSRPSGQSSLNGKPVGIIGGIPGMLSSSFTCSSLGLPHFYMVSNFSYKSLYFFLWNHITPYLLEFHKTKVRL
jgi:hypothetical protein